MKKRHVMMALIVKLCEYEMEREREREREEERERRRNRLGMRDNLYSLQFRDMDFSDLS